VSGFFEGGGAPRIWATETTREQALGIAPADATEQQELLGGVEVLSLAERTSFRLGDLEVVVNPRSGHTDSDVTIEVQEPRIVFFGDLVWNRMFPNYMSATPSKLSASVREAIATRFVDYVPGHGPRATRQEVGRYLELLDHVEQAARQAHEKGVSAADAAKSYALPEAIADWTLFSPDYFEVAIGAWHKELG
jgi:glyoxylase-like metal-dependent hydrolase (beta-lactamase superfamily II)